MKDPGMRHRSRMILLAGLIILLLIGVIPPALALADCPSGCSCMLPADANKLNYGYCGAKQQLCGYDRTQQAMYCYTNPPATTCPSGCECLSDAAAKATLGSYVKCSETACGAEQTAAAVIPRYCVKKAPEVTVTIQTCPTGCECMPESQAQQQPNLYVRCSDTPCSQVVTGSAVIRNYCYKKTQTTVCPQGCTCMAEAKAVAVYGSYERCSDTLCSSSPNTGTAAGAAPAPEYCFRQKAIVTTCPAGFDCMSEATAKQKYGNYKKSSDTVCGYDQYTAAQVPKYCIAKAETPAATCPSGCSCMAVEDAKNKNYNYCNNVQTACGYDVYQRQLFCFGTYTPPACSYNPNTNACTGSCLQGNSCGIAYSVKDDSGKLTAVCSCLPPAVSQCTYDKEKGCAGTCPNGGQCMKLGQTQSATSNVATPLCGCQNADCYFDYSLDTCAGKCSVSTETCQINTIYRNAVTGKTEYAECHCKGTGISLTSTLVTLVPGVTTTSPAAVCACDVTSGSCTGTCPAPQSCVITTWAPGADKMCTTCECKDVCRLDDQGQCTGTCPNNGACKLMTKVDTTTGKEVRSCNCEAGTAPATQAPATDIFTAIGNFFKSLFGMK